MTLPGRRDWCEAACHPGAISIVTTAIKVEDLFNAPGFTCLSSITSETVTFFLCLLAALLQHKLWLCVLLYFPIKVLVPLKNRSILSLLILSMSYLWQSVSQFLAFTFCFLTPSCFAFSVLSLVCDFSYHFRV